MLPCNHEWTVFSTCLDTTELMVKCIKCDAFGTVAAPTRDEWMDAFFADDNPYLWDQPHRVKIREGALWQRKAKY